MNFPQEVVRLIGMLESAGHEAWAVGGCVRDSLLGRTPHDWDLCTSASPQEMEQALSAFRMLRTGERHGTLTVLLEDTPYEITTYRADGEYENHRRPRQVQYVSCIREDLARRDFTINAMAAHPERGVLDLFGGREDLEAGVIRCVGEPQRRFEEDALRILRALRFAARFGFEIEAETRRAMGERASLMLVLSAERIWSEISRLAVSPHAGTILRRHGALLCDVAPGMDMRHAECLSRCPQEDLALRLALLFESDAQARKTLTRLRAPKRVLERTCLLLGETEPPQPSRPWMRKALSRLGEEALRQRFQMVMAQDGLNPACPGVLEEVLQNRDPYRPSMLCVSGADLVLSGVCPKGPACGLLLDALLLAVMEDRLENTRPALMEAARALAPGVTGRKR